MLFSVAHLPDIPVPTFTIHDGVILFWQTVQNFLKSFVARLPYLLIGIVVFTLFWLAGKLLRRVFTKVAIRTHAIDATLANFISRILSTLVAVFGFFVACVVVFPSFKPADIFAGLGITSVAIGFAFKDILQNFFAGLLILWRRPFRVGDQIKFKEFEGTVEDINMRSTRLRTYDGERAILPNGEVYNSSLLVRTAYDQRRVKFAVSLDYAKDIDKAQELICQTLSSIDGVMSDPAPTVYVADLAGTTITLTIYFWVESASNNVPSVTNKAISAVKLTLAHEGMR